MRTTSIAFLMLLAAACQSIRSGTSIPIPGTDPSQPRVVESAVPAGAAVGSVPAIVLMHGCAGVQTNTSDWRARFEAAGWHVAVMDSHGPRGVSNNCNAKNASEGMTHLIRVADAYGALDHLASQPHIDVDRILMMGWSEGAIVAGLAQTVPMLRLYDREGHRNQFAGAISIAPNCDNWTWNGKPLVKRTLVVIGSADDWTPAPLCKTFLSNYASSDMELHILDGATHAFDTFRSRNGHILTSRNYLGYRLIPSQAATKEAVRLVGAFVGEDLSGS